MLARIPWNLTRKVERFHDADVIVLSLGKSGRTWLRVMLHRALALEYDLSFDPIRLDPGSSPAPRIAYTHELATHLRADPLGKQLLGRSILPRSLTDRKRLVVLVRDPRDVVVSSYFHKRERSRKTDIPLEAFIHHPRWGIEPLVAILNRWRRRFADHPRCHWVHYEALRRAPEAEMARLFEALEVPVGKDAIARSVEAARFDRMQAAEAAGEFSDPRLRPGDVDRPESFKVRRGKVGGYRDEFAPEAIAFLDAAVARLDPFFGYGPTTVEAREARPSDLRRA